MLPGRTSACTTSLRDSYIAISKYVNRRLGQPLPKLRRSFSCQHSLRKATNGKTAEERQKHPPTIKDEHEDRAKPSSDIAEVTSHYKSIFDLPRATTHWEIWNLQPNRKSTLYGYITSLRRTSTNLDFLDFVDPQLRKGLQLIIDEDIIGSVARQNIRKLRPHSPVAVTGQLLSRGTTESVSKVDEKQERFSARSITGGPDIILYDSPAPTSSAEPESGEGSRMSTTPKESRFNPFVGEVATLPKIEMSVESVLPLNHFPGDIIARAKTNFSPAQRHLELRTHSGLRQALQARSKCQTECRKYLFVKGFDEIETPILFKSTPEGAREFLVPTRQKGLAYALPQSPQQFKQILMASGISKYFQFARCFRDEDSRADRQPEFTQLDIEMAFASSEDVMKITERIIQVIWRTFFRQNIFRDERQHPKEYTMRDIPSEFSCYFPRFTYNEAMSSWGSDKPDMRLGPTINQVQDLLDPTLISKLSPLKDPVVDLLRVRVTSTPPKTKGLIAEFLDQPSALEYLKNPHGSPGVFVMDPSQPMNGFSTFEHESAEKITNLIHPQRGDLLILQARPNQPFAGEGSTMMGNLRRDLHLWLADKGLHRNPLGHHFLWVTDFPLFSPATDSDPGQGGQRGIKSTHHPFTAPKEASDIDKMFTDPLSCTADHFDLVINGVEVGGGSRRIHDSRMQEMVLKDILQIPERQAEGFRPLLEALRAGCPPHAGIALGFDRLMAILRDTSTVRDVIAFPKSARGQDKMVGAPSEIDAHRWAEYHMAPKKSGKPQNTS